MEIKANKFYQLNNGGLEYIREIRTHLSYPVRGLRDTYSAHTQQLSRVTIEGIEVSLSSSEDSRIVICSSTVFSEPKVYSWACDSNSLGNLLRDITADIETIASGAAKVEEVRNKGRDMAPKHVDITTEIVVEIEHHDTAPINDRYMEVVGCISALTKGINNNSILKDSKEVAEAFLKAKKEIEGLATVRAKPSSSKDGGWMKRYFGKVDPTATPSGQNASVQDNIDYLFGLIHEKYEKLVTTGEGLQAAKGQISAQLIILEDIAKESSEALSKYVDKTTVPMRTLALDTQIKASAEKYKDRLLKIDGAILATQTTIISLGKDLPAMKTDLTDEMAISGLLTDVGDYQAMYSQIAGLVSDVTTSTSEKTHEVIENVLTMQIEDDHTTKYLEASVVRGEKFAAMITDKSGQLATKTKRDAEFIEQVVSKSQIANARSSIKMIDNTL